MTQSRRLGLPFTRSQMIQVGRSTAIEANALLIPFASSAKEMVKNMVTVANSDKEEHIDIVNQAFSPNADQDEIKKVIHNRDVKQTRVDTTDKIGRAHV